MANAISWFEIPANDLNRACDFYAKVLSQDVHTQDINGLTMGFLHNGEDGVGGALVKGEGYLPSAEGALVYLNGGEDLSAPLSKVEEFGGQVVLPKTKISDEIGYFAIFIDSEGNKVAFHSPN
ncbi:VOC family protein [Fulvivirga sp. RKSG066]|uniref:VOC family protein n=1 Tax=Fulvivirga aurantia TaxID=2529383 RepID=UPI0012BCADE4|nr:VOC family protein [Fulvivirga aurantia]MTI22907.1 VOC family protein [Fulvivirga aurantia]